MRNTTFYLLAKPFNLNIYLTGGDLFSPPVSLTFVRNQKAIVMSTFFESVLGRQYKVYAVYSNGLHEFIPYVTLRELSRDYESPHPSELATALSEMVDELLEMPVNCHRNFRPCRDDIISAGIITRLS